MTINAQSDQAGDLMLEGRIGEKNKFPGSRPAPARKADDVFE